MTHVSIKESGFAGKLMEVLDHVEYRRIESSEDMEDVARLRYKAYKAHAVLPVAAKNLIDDIDFDDHAYIFGVYYYEELVSTVRIHHVTPDHRVCQSTGRPRPPPAGPCCAPWAAVPRSEHSRDAGYRRRTWDRATGPEPTSRPRTSG